MADKGLKVLILQHLERETPGSMSDYLNSRGAMVSTVRLYADDPLPADVESLDAVVCLGGVMHPDQEAEHPFLIRENDFIKRVAEAGVPFLGICLGAQLLAMALGAPVYRAPNKEIGLFFVEFNEGGLADPLFKNLPPRMAVIEAHEYTFDLPVGAVLLASSQFCPNQAFRYKNSCAIQFHIEVTLEKIKYWLEELSEPGLIDLNPEEIVHHFTQAQPFLLSQANVIYKNFFEWAASRR